LRKIPITYPDGSKDTIQSNYQFQFQNSSIRLATHEVEVIKKIYPNPCREFLNLFLPNISSLKPKVNIYDISGALMSINHHFLDNIISLDTSPLKVGYYIVDIINRDNKHFIAKFTKSE
jgi:hypothetical protein